MNSSILHYPTKVIIEEGGCTKFFSKIQSKIIHLFVVSGKKSMRELGVLDAIKSYAKKYFISCTFSTGVSTNPTNEEIDNIYQELLESKADSVLGIGGGSSMDTAKLIGMMATNGGESWDYVNLENREGREINNIPLPTFLIPTTSGSASESTPFAVLTNSETRMKKGIGHVFLYPELCVLDSILLDTMPQNVLAITGFDAFCQALEGYTSKNKNFHSEFYALQSLSYIISNFEKSWNVDSTYRHKINMAWGTLMSGLSIGIVDVNLAHAMSHPISGYKGIQHGLAVLICTIPSIRFNQDVLKDKYKRVAQLMGYDDGGANEIIEYISKLIDKFEINIRLKDYDVSALELEKFANDALQIGCINTNSKNVTKSDLMLLYQQAWSGDYD